MEKRSFIFLNVPFGVRLYYQVIVSEIGWQLGGTSSGWSHMMERCVSSWSRLSLCTVSHFMASGHLKFWLVEAGGVGAAVMLCGV